MSCLFCNIASSDIDSASIYENNDSFAFLDVQPIALGHTLIVPKKHADNILDLPDASVGPLFLAVKKVTEMLKETFAPEGFTIGINQGRISGQTVNHLHIHVIPRYSGDGGGSMHSIVDNPPDEDIKETQRRIKETNL